jgi:hypothetical protein
MAGLQLPIVLSKLSYLIDNPWNVSLGRANSGGLILADSLIDRNLGNRPVTLLGFSLGSRLIFSCLKELAARGAFGLVQNVYLFGSPIVANQDEYLKARSAVCGRFVNGYTSNDWILGYLFRATGGGIMRVAGLAPVEGIPGIENINVTEFVNGHMAYRAAIPRLLREMGWEVESDEFTEIEDPDPDNHQERQRELIREIDEARKEAEAKPDKKRFGFFKRGKLAEKKGWETYDVERKDANSLHSSDSAGGGDSSVLFDIDAIRAELASEQIEVRQLESTLPPMKLDLNSSNSSPLLEPPQETPSVKHKRSTSDAGLKADPAPPINWPERSVSTGHFKGSSASLSDQRERPEDQRCQNDRWVPHNEEEDIKMTFDTSYHSPPLPSTSPAPSQRQCSTHSFPEFSRPELTSSMSMPIGRGMTGMSSLGSINLAHNAWADDDYDDMKEENIRMTFE